MLPAMHTQTNLDQGLLQGPPSLPSHPLLTLKDKAANERIFVPTKKINRYQMWWRLGKVNKAVYN